MRLIRTVGARFRAEGLKTLPSAGFHLEAVALKDLYTYLLVDVKDVPRNLVTPPRAGNK